MPHLLPISSHGSGAGGFTDAPSRRSVGDAKISPWQRWVLVAALTAATAINAATIEEGPAAWSSSAAAVACGVVLLAGRRWWPAPALVTVTAAVWGSPMLPLMVVALFDTVTAGHLAAAVTLGVSAPLGNLLFHPTVPLWVPQSYGAALFLGIGIALGVWFRRRRELLEAMESNVESMRTERDLREQAARASERSAIAAEMHDVLAHRLSLIALHSGVLAITATDVPEGVRQRLQLLRGSAKDALADLRDVLGALHGQRAEAPDNSAAPALREMAEVVGEARAAGQHVEVSLDGAPDDAPTSHRLAVLRVVQESLTNCRKHAQGSAVHVHVGYRAPATIVRVTNDLGVGSPDPTPSGFGLVGLAERVRALGGILTAGPVGQKEWRVVAQIPHRSYDDVDQS